MFCFVGDLGVAGLRAGVIAGRGMAAAVGLFVTSGFTSRFTIASSHLSVLFDGFRGLSRLLKEGEAPKYRGKCLLSTGLIDGRFTYATN